MSFLVPLVSVDVFVEAILGSIAEAALLITRILGIVVHKVQASTSVYTVIVEFLQRPGNSVLFGMDRCAFATFIDMIEQNIFQPFELALANKGRLQHDSPLDCDVVKNIERKLHCNECMGE